LYPILELKSGREKSVINRHPWLFSGAVKTFPKAQNGDIIAVCDNKAKVLGYGFYSPNSQIVCRFFHFGVEEDIRSKEFWLSKFKRAYSLRKDLVITQNTNAFRLVHAEGDFLPGIVCDIYKDTAVLQILVKGTEKLVEIYVECLKDLGINYVYAKTKTSSHEIENIVQTGWLTANGETMIEILENGIKFIVDIEKGQKTGFFIDQRENRQLLRDLSKGKKVLNTFSYTGGFSAYAIKGGASLVHSVDISKDAIRLCEENIALNSPTTIHGSCVADCFDYLKTTEEMYDIIVLDPPAFAKNAKSVPNACRGYKELNMMGIKKVKSGGLIMTYSCSQNIDKVLFQKIVFGAAADVGRNVKILKHLEQPMDHPVNIFHPEGEYLKGLLLLVE